MANNQPGGSGGSGGSGNSGGSGGSGGSGSSSGSGGSGSGSDQKKKAPGINDMILGSLKSRSGRETTNWINNLTSEGMQEIEDASKVQPASPALPAQFAHPSIAQTQVKWVDKLFDLLQQYEVEFNRAVQDPDLRVFIERAVITPELIARLQSNDQYHYSGRLHTRFWTLAIRGNFSHVEAYMIPSDHYIGFENNISSYSQCFEFIPVWDGELKWSFLKGAIGINQLPSMAKLIFGHLVKVSKGDADSEEPFNFGISAQAPAPKPMGGPALQSSLAGGSGEPDSFKAHSAVFEEDGAVQGSDRAVETSTREPGQTSAEPVHQGSSAPPAAGRSAQTNAPPAVPEEVGMAAACEILIKAVDRELDLMSKAGSRAFEYHDFVVVEKLMKRTTKLKSMRDSMLATIAEWKQLLDEGS